MKLTVPQSLEIEHQEIREELAALMKAGGRTGDSARAVMRVLRPHMEREDDFVVPALALLRPLAAGLIVPEMAPVLGKAEMLKSELSRMIEEHGRIVAALRELMRAAVDEQQPGAARFAQRLIVHAQAEEELLYPAAILVGEYLKGRLAS
jgi:hypothetical protein